MLKIKVFDCEDEEDLERRLNQFSNQCEENDLEIIDIKFSTSHMIDDEGNQIYCFSALAMYNEDNDKYIQNFLEMINSRESR